MSGSPSHRGSVRRVSRYQFTHVRYLTAAAARAQWQLANWCMHGAKWLSEMSLTATARRGVLDCGLWLTCAALLILTPSLCTTVDTPAVHICIYHVCCYLYIFYCVHYTVHLSCRAQAWLWLVSVNSAWKLTCSLSSLIKVLCHNCNFKGSTSQSAVTLCVWGWFHLWIKVWVAGKAVWSLVTPAIPECS